MKIELVHDNVTPTHQAAYAVTRASNGWWILHDRHGIIFNHYDLATVLRRARAVAGKEVVWEFGTLSNTLAGKTQL